MAPIVEVLTTKENLIDRALAIVIDCIKTAVNDRQRCTLALSGGSTPKPLYEALAQTPLPWEQLHCFWGDERYVPIEHPDSNQRMARQAWLDRIPIPAQNIHPMPTSAGDPHLDAHTHETELHTFFSLTPGEFPEFDLVLLGLGPDGHTASLFPHTPALDVVDRLVTVGMKDGQPRLTFTAQLINQSRYVLFIVAGENKRPALQEIFAENGNSQQYPARLIRPQGILHWLLDEEAGELFR